MQRCVLGLDLGAKLGYGVLTGTTLATHGVIAVDLHHPHRMLRALEELHAKHGFTDVGYEAVDFSVSRKQTEAHAAIRTVVFMFAEKHRRALHEVPVAYVNKAVTGSGSAMKKQVAQGVETLYGVKVKAGDAADACAVAHAVTVDATRRTWAYGEGQEKSSR